MREISKEQSKDAGLAVVLVLLITALTTHAFRMVSAALVLLVMAMIVPQLFKPFARLWFRLSHVIDAATSTFLLTLIFCFVVTPVGFLRRMLGHDPMQLSAWRHGSGTAFTERPHLFIAKDLEKPY